MTYALGVAGYPASGKSVVADIAETVGFEVVTMGDAVRQKTRENWGDRLTAAENGESDELPSDVYGEFATLSREEHGRGIVAEWCVDGVMDGKGPVFIDGMRSPEERDAFESLSEFELLFIHAPASLRLDWIRERGRDGEEKFGAEKLLERDMNENGWGVNELVQTADYTVHNCTTKEQFESDLKTLLESLYSEHC